MRSERRTALSHTQKGIADMSATQTVRAILRTHPQARFNPIQAYLIHLTQLMVDLSRRAGDDETVNRPIAIATFLRTWQRHRRTFL